MRLNYDLKYKKLFQLYIKPSKSLTKLINI